ncbi:hypothetical protein Afil01_15970 [Actinorhabdospora filicis]|uniref:Outer membrane channel protein CpnT-like N-terminal domain-containing protein n=1 Tax=Actinorhabdospora filicis TaxID=1785913 RepID=A0A9W6W9M7_9ACTN|nr:PPE domain-containing protein [Actinorhabdospora filicis]GLZ76790.1 hypothetical protein Afil01_15970 [Actinorhabdospora filicis]
MTNPLIVTAGSPNPTGGARLADSAYNTVNDFKNIGGENFSGIALGMDLLTVGLDFLAVVANPLKELMMAGIGFLIEQVEPLREAIHAVTGNPYEITALAKTWTQLAVELRQAADDYTAATGQLKDWHGETAEGYLRVAADFQMSLKGAASWCEEVATGVAVTGAVVSTIKALVVELISDLVCRAIMVLVPAIASAAVTFGASLASGLSWFFAQMAITCARIGSAFAKLLKAAGRLAGRFGRMGQTMRTVGNKLESAGTNLASKSRAMRSNAANRHADFATKADAWKTGTHTKIGDLKKKWQDNYKWGNPKVAANAPDKSWYDPAVRWTGSYPATGIRGAASGTKDAFGSRQEGTAHEMDAGKDERPATGGKA